MSDSESDGSNPPARLCIHQKSPHYHAAALERGVGIRFNGSERNDVEEYSLSEQWIRVAVGRARDRHGNPMTIKLNGKVEAFWREV